MAADLLKYYSAFQASQQVLNKVNIMYFPFNIMNVLKKHHNILIETLSEYKKFNPNSTLKINDARCFYLHTENVYLIVYNENKPINRIRFSIAHELGHIILNHLSDERTELSRGGLGNMEYRLLEGQANVFAGTFLVPPILIKEYLLSYGTDIENVKQEHLSAFFAISSSASNYRINDFKIWQTLDPSIDEVQLVNRCKISMYPNYCHDCKTLFFMPEAKYCINCHSTTLLRYKEYNMKYSFLDLNDYGKTTVCPVCKNENTNIEGNYCQICGTHIANICTNHTCSNNINLPPDARYCPFCGSETSFLRDKLLLSWNNENKNTISKDTEDIDDFPF